MARYRGSRPKNQTRGIQVGHRKFVIDELDMRRLASRKAARATRKMSPEQAAAYLKLVDLFERAIIWERFTAHVADALDYTNPLAARFNIYDLNRRLNRVLADIQRWVWRNRTFSEEKIKEFAAQVMPAAKSVCTVFDRAASCWRKDTLAGST